MTNSVPKEKNCMS